MKLKGDLEELIRLQVELDDQNDTTTSRFERGVVGASGTESEAPNWQVGDRCMIRLKGGLKQMATIDGLSHGKAAITFLVSGQKEFLKLTELLPAPAGDEHAYLYSKSVNSTAANVGISKKDWRAEKERRKLRAQKKDARRKAYEEEQEKEKKSWKNFNTKATTKGFKGIKRVVASGSAADGPRGGIDKNKNALISSRTTMSNFGFTNRGNMDSLF